ncbi:MAG: branched-chain-amino-acid transaminase [Gammaproteobacteria bacterium]|nr:branched-chain-amino-acid transaminase [Gammaproteobacteria bacterium]
MPAFWLNGKIVAAEYAKLSVFDHGLLYGDGVFEGIRFYNANAFRLAEHLTRLYDSAAAICLNIPYSIDNLVQAIQATISDYSEQQGYLRLVVTRGEGPLGLDPMLCGQANVFIIADSLAVVEKTVLQNGARLIIASTRRLPSDGLDPRIKSLNYLNHILARIEATNAKADEAILLNRHGNVAEGTADNLFIVKNNTVATPAVSDGALAGVTRALIMQLADTMGLVCTEKTLAPYDLYTADECFLTGTAAELIPVRMIDQRLVASCPGRIYQQLHAAFIQQVQQETKRLN